MLPSSKWQIVSGDIQCCSAREVTGEGWSTVALISAALYVYLSGYVGTVRTSCIPAVQETHIICDHLCYIYASAIPAIIAARLDPALYTYQRALVRILRYAVCGLVPDDRIDEVSFWLSLLFEIPVACDRKRYDRCAIRRLP